MTNLTVTGIDKSFGGTPVLSGQSLEVAAWEFVALLGPSGGGKSTLLQIINGLLPADAGSVVLNGEDITGRPANGAAWYSMVRICCPGVRRWITWFFLVWS